MARVHIWILFFLVFSGVPTFAGPVSSHDPDSLKDESGEESSIFLSPITFYQKIISPAVGNRCQMYPSCSAYSKEAFHEHGFLVGWFMTCDRLMRCGRDETELSPQVRTPQGPLTSDPLWANDGWMK